MYVKIDITLNLPFLDICWYVCLPVHIREDARDWTVFFFFSHHHLPSVPPPLLFFKDGLLNFEFFLPRQTGHLPVSAFPAVRFQAYIPCARFYMVIGYSIPSPSACYYSYCLLLLSTLAKAENSHCRNQSVLHHLCVDFRTGLIMWFELQVRRRFLKSRFRLQKNES